MIDDIRCRSLAVQLVPGIVASTLLVPAVAQAQDEARIDEIVTTAQRREESALDVPITVDVFGDADIRKTGSLTLEEMQDFIPGFEVGSSPTQAGITVRGVSSANISTGGDPSIATFYDDVYVPRAATQMTFGDMARVEVLKGPQGTLYGRNAAAGVINLVPNSPANENEAFVRTRIGNYELMRIEAMGNVAVSDSFFLRGNILSNQRDGYITNVVSGERDPGEQDNLALRVAALWEVSNTTSLQLSYDYDELDNAPRAAIGVSQWAECPDDPFCGRVRNDVIDGEESRDMSAITAKLFHEFDDRWSSKLVAGYREYEVVNKQDEDGTAELDRYLVTDNIEDSDILYSELQFNFQGDRANLVFGANYSREDTYQEIPVGANTWSAMRAVSQQLGSALNGLLALQGLPEYPFDHFWNPQDMAVLLNIAEIPNPLNNGGAWDPDSVTATGDAMYEVVEQQVLPAFGAAGTPFLGPSLGVDGNGNPVHVPWTEYYFNEGKFTNWGIYGDIDYQINDRWSVLAGLRYSNDDKSFSWQSPPNTVNELRAVYTNNIIFIPEEGYLEAVTGTLRGSDSWDKVTGRAVLQYQVSDSAQAFASYSTGYISGGFDSLNVRTSDNPLRPEESENIEIGIKGELFDGRLRAQLSLFDMTVEGRKRTVDSMPPTQSQASPTVITGDQDFKGFEVTLDWMPTDSLNFGFLTTVRDTDAKWEPFYNAVGELVIETSSSSTDTDFTVMTDWSPSVPTGSLAVRAEYIFNENSRADDPTLIDSSIPGLFEDRELLNARVAWTSDDDKWMVALWGKNLLDNESISGVADISTGAFGTTFVSVYPPRTYGIELGVNFR